MLEQGYGIMPNKILFDKDISSTSKLVYVLMSSLSAEKGYCWANNKYFADKLSISERQVSRSIKELGKYIHIQNGKNDKRQLWLDKNVYVPRQKCRSSLDKNVYHNNIKNNITNNVEKEINRRYGYKPSVLPANVILERI